METEEIIQLPTCGSDSGSDRDEAHKLSQELHEAEVEDHMAKSENPVQSVDRAEIEEGQLIQETEISGDVIGDSSNLHEKVDFVGTSETQVLDNGASCAERPETSCLDSYDVEEGQLIPETGNIVNAVVESVNFTGSVTKIEGNNASLNKVEFAETVTEIEGKCFDMPSENGSMSYPKIDAISGVKRTRTTFDEQQQSVHVKYNGLSRQSKRKLEELMREWSKWTAQNCFSVQDHNEVSESGEEIYFPALDIGMGKTSAVSFWVENEIRKPQNKDFVPVEDDSVPLYDRGFALGLTSADGSSNLEGGLEVLDAPRCFNCGSYNHSLKECPKPRDNAAVNNSRKQLKSKRNQTAGSRNPTRYYQESPGGKYEGLKAGVLDTETRRLLGLGEFDPPPWLHRMREIGYPPGYLEPEDEDLPSGITIFGDEEIKEDKEEGEILEADFVEPGKKMTVKFPGINAPIPQNGDEWLWATRPSNSDRHRNGDGGRSNYSSDSNSRGRYREYNNRDFNDDDPLGLDRAPRYPRRYSDYEPSSASRSLRENAPRPRSPSSGRSLGDRARNDPLDSEDSAAYSLYSSFSYSSNRRVSEFGNGSDVGRGDHPDYSSRSRDREDRHRHRSGR